MTLPVYPVGLPLPLRESYSFSPVNRIRRSEMDSGRARQRIDFNSVPTMLTLRWHLTAAQASIFESWVQGVVGSGWFNMTILSPLGFDTEELRFTETPKGGELIGKYSWRYSAVVEVKEQPVLDPDWINILPEYVLNADIFDRAMNQEWPLSPWQIYASEFDTAINEDWPTP